jgi:hypothetical protein
LLAGREFVTVSGMSENIHWPAGEFTLEEAVRANAALPEAAIRKELADAIASKTLVQTKKGNHKIKGKFQAVAAVQ